jgi:DMSO/TMAO reductase YedYZ molybdopterin-dependent catalytic subunit
MAQKADDPFASGKLLGNVEFVHEGAVELGTASGTELDGRLYTDLSGVTAKSVVTPSDQFYLRTRASTKLPSAENWKVEVNGLAERAMAYSVRQLADAAKPVGVHVMECAGNVRLTRFALISTGDWAGVLLADILGESKLKAQATRVLINGFDTYAQESATSVAGASWVFSLEELKAARAFLATRLGGKPLTKDHGGPVRLVVPGWYGCACIKWVERVTLVNDAAESTSQMLEYAARTHQKGAPQLARDYESATVDQAAMPVRVEKWLVAGKIKYRVVGILWGGAQPVRELQIRFNPEEQYLRVDNMSHMQNDPWSIWTHAWSPKAPGTYTIRLMVKEPAVRTRRLDSGYYARTLEITET